MDNRDSEIIELMVKQTEDEARDNPEARKKGGRYVQSAFPGGPAKKAPATTSKVRFGERSRFTDDQYAALAKKPAPGPREGKSMAELQEEARKRRADQRAAERSR